jgi:DNA polymerase V
MNPAYPVIIPAPDTLEIFGVVVHFVHSPRKRN